MNRIASDRLIAAIKAFEGFRPEAYEDLAGIWTIGYGETRDVLRGQIITESAAEQLLRCDLAKSAELLNLMLHSKLPSDRIDTMTQGQFDALLDFAYNLGLGSLFRSTLWRHFVAGDLAAAAAEFAKWDEVRGEAVPGLAKRRAMEQQWFQQAAT